MIVFIIYNDLLNNIVVVLTITVMIATFHISFYNALYKHLIMFVTIYYNNILIYSSSELKDYIKCIKKVLKWC